MTTWQAPHTAQQGKAPGASKVPRRPRVSLPPRSLLMFVRPAHTRAPLRQKAASTVSAWENAKQQRGPAFNDMGTGAKEAPCFHASLLTVETVVAKEVSKFNAGNAGASEDLLKELCHNPSRLSQGHTTEKDWHQTTAPAKRERTENLHRSPKK